MTHPVEPPAMSELLRSLRDLSEETSRDGLWPDRQLRLLSEAGVLRWMIPPGYGGQEQPEAEWLEHCRHLAAACLTSTFVLTQRQAAVQRIVSSENRELKDDLLPRLVTDELSATVGISHLTTSRQHWQQPTVMVERVDAGFILTGEVPWVSGADRADVIVTGGTLRDGRQVLLALHTDTAGVSVSEPARLLALNGSRTASVRLNQAYVPLQHLLHGPAHGVMKLAGTGTGSLVTSTLAAGHAERAMELIELEAARRPELEAIAGLFRGELASLVDDLRTAALLRQQASEAASSECSGPSAETLRERANSLVLRLTQGLLAVSKGAGYVADHPAALLASEALFFLVWSCPQPVMLAGLRTLAQRPDAVLSASPPAGEVS